MSQLWSIKGCLDYFGVETLTALLQEWSRDEHARVKVAHGRILVTTGKPASPEFRDVADIRLTRFVAWCDMMRESIGDLEGMD